MGGEHTLESKARCPNDLGGQRDQRLFDPIELGPYHPRPMPPKVIGPYRVLETLGSGGVGTVYRAIDRRSGEMAALKLLSTGPALDPRAARRLAREFENGRVSSLEIDTAMRCDASDVQLVIRYSLAGGLACEALCRLEYKHT